MAPPLRHNGNSKRPGSLEDIFSEEDPFGLLDVEAKASSHNSPIEETRFEEINAFIDAHHRLPTEAATGDVAERLMARRLQGYQRTPALHEPLKRLDRHNLLPEPSHTPLDTAGPSDEPQTTNPSEEVTSLDDIFASEAFGELEPSEEELFNPVNVRFGGDRDLPDEIAQRKACQDFYRFETLFDRIHEQLQSGTAKTRRFQKASQMRAGDTFILQGIVCLIDEVGEHREDNFGNYDPRLRVIFDNGTESNLLLRSLGKALYQDETGRRIIPEADTVVDDFNNVTHRDKRVGQIYFVTTKSQDPKLKTIPNLVKIGYTEQSVEKRTANAARDTAFLEAPVKLLASMECYNMNPHKFETLIHGFLHAQRLKMTLIGKDGTPYHPKEWFSVSLDTAREVVKKIVDGTIVQYRMDNTTGRLVKKTGNSGR